MSTDLDGFNKSLHQPWRGAEAIHFWLLGQRQIHSEDYHGAVQIVIFHDIH
jgi:hypothetical protein